jgi:hypothetical protein
MATHGAFATANADLARSSYCSSPPHRRPLGILRAGLALQLTGFAVLVIVR